MAMAPSLSQQCHGNQMDGEWRLPERWVMEWTHQKSPQTSKRWSVKASVLILNCLMDKTHRSLEFGVYCYWKSFFIAFETYKSRKHRLPNSDTNREKVYNTSNTSKRSISGHLLWWSSRIREKPKLDFLLYVHLFYHRNKTVIIINDI